MADSQNIVLFEHLDGTLELNVKNQRFTESGLRKLLEEVKSEPDFSNITKISFTNCNFFPKEIGIVYEYLNKLPNLTHLNFSYNRLYGISPELLSGLLAIPTLTELILFGCELGNAGAIAIATSMQKNTTLEYLVLTDNNIYDEGGKAFAAMVSINTTLKGLNLSKNIIYPYIKNLIDSEKSKSLIFRAKGYIY